jgi:hypothetical protein
MKTIFIDIGTVLVAATEVSTLTVRTLETGTIIVEGIVTKETSAKTMNSRTSFPIHVTP